MSVVDSSFLRPLFLRLLHCSWLFSVRVPASIGSAYAVFVTLRSLRIVQLGLLLLLFVLARSLGLSWRSYSFGIALGYGLYAAVDLVLAAVRTQFGEGIWHLHSLLTTTAFTGMLFVWLFYILQRQAVAQPVRVIPYNDIAKWNEKLEELLKRKAA